MKSRPGHSQGWNQSAGAVQPGEATTAGKARSTRWCCPKGRLEAGQAHVELSPQGAVEEQRCSRRLWQLSHTRTGFG